MAQILLMMIASAAMLMGSSISHGDENGDGVIIYVGGRVLCQDCAQGWNEWVHGSKPIKGSKVAVTCMDERKRVICHESDETDEKGAYEIKINNNVNGKKVDPTKCLLRLESSPDSVCNIATDFSGGRSGVKLKNPNVVYRNMVKYMYGPFYYTTPMCSDPDSSDDDTNDGEN